MNKQFFSAALLCGTLIVTAANADDAPSLSGNWKIHNSIYGNESEATCTFTQKDATLSGTCQGDTGSREITGKIDGKKVTWTLKTEYNGGPLTLTYTASVTAPDKFNGNVRVEEYNVDGDFTATLAK